MGSVGIMKNSTTLICGLLMAERVEEMVKEMKKAKSEGADVVEIQLDCIKDFEPKKDLEILLHTKPLPVIISFGQTLEANTHSIVDALILAKELGADYIDIDMKVASLLQKHGKFDGQGKSKIIVSSFVDTLASTDDDLSNLVAQLQSTGADIIKIVANTTYITECARLFHLLSHCLVPLIVYATGERGLIGQLLNPKFGGFLVYGSLEEKPLHGLLTLTSLRKVYRVDNVDTETKVFGLISKPVKHSKGPLLHNPTFRHVDYNGIYVPMLVDNLKEFFTVYSDPEFAGFSVGIPYKEAILEYCDEVHPLAQRIGAVNTIIRQPFDGKLIGYNTDCEASITAIEDALKAQGCKNEEAFLPSMLSGRMFVVVGAGGAGRALAFGAQSRRARVIIFDIDLDRANSLANAVGGEAYSFEQLCHFQPEQGAILANATPIGMHPNKDRIPVAENTLKTYKLVFDAVYNPRMTTLLREAKAAGPITVSGVEMFLRQAIGQFNLFTGNKAPEEFMRDVIMENF